MKEITILVCISVWTIFQTIAPHVKSVYSNYKGTRSLNIKNRNSLNIKNILKSLLCFESAQDSDQ